LNAKPRQADVVGVMKFGRIELACLKPLQKRIVAHGHSSEVEFHRDLSPANKFEVEKKKAPIRRSGPLR
jgi:hypothetical protein